ncbi:NAD(P)-dependent oxidoreductase [Egibacter rhizosphaerae]|uniref:NAD(P)-dependent oxidoreductase n=1 Tax=Egibacter rhizosphaerae TaxID=1670831 RepID=A0A411YGY2_9ACTN|nr:DUF1932 domain-containing protein [Egibacter rhizosphaerae]QBI20498.1 NAD(P)-dependent oxidoreductase [Egibacter rhizosphaerae]
MTTPRVGFLGLGEAGAAIAAGFAAAGASVRAYDLALQDPDRADAVTARADAAGVELADGTAELLSDRDLVCSLVTSDVAVRVAQDAAPHLGAGQVYADLNSTEPAQMERVAELLGPSGAEFVDGALMAGVPGPGHRVPVLMSGPGAERAASWWAQLGGEVDVLSDVVGAASVVKLARSLVVKGLESLFWESAIVAERYGEAERVLASLGTTLPGEQWNEFAGYLMGRTVRHGERRAHELDGVARMLEAAGLDPHMARATGARLRTVVAGLGPDATPASLPADPAGLARAADDDAPAT